MLVMEKPPLPGNDRGGLVVPPYAIYNMGNSKPENLLEFLNILQEELVEAGVLPSDYDFEGHRKLVPMQPGDVAIACADVGPLVRDFGFRPTTPLRHGLREFARWYHFFYVEENGK